MIKCLNLLNDLDTLKNIMLNGARKSHLSHYPKLSISNYHADLFSKIAHHTPAQSVILAYQYQGKEYRYAVAVSSTACNYGGYRYWWHCPKCERRVGILYCEGFYTCRHCIGANYATQLTQPIDKLFKNVADLRNRLGWQAGIAHGQGNRPKGMHQATFNRLTHEHQQLQQQIIGKLRMLAKGTITLTSKKAINDITLEDIIHELEFARTIASLKGNANAMIAVSMAKAKLLGLDNGQLDAPLEPIFNAIDVTPDNFDKSLNTALKNCQAIMTKLILNPTSSKKGSKIK